MADVTITPTAATLTTVPDTLEWELSIAAPFAVYFGTYWTEHVLTGRFDYIEQIV